MPNHCDVFLHFTVDNNDSLVLTWKDAVGALPPYILTRNASVYVDTKFRLARESLARLVKLRLNGAKPQDEADECFVLAGHGYDIRLKISEPEFENWVSAAKANPNDLINVLIVAEGQKNYSWNLVYESPPQRKLFTPATLKKALEPFWGVCFGLSNVRPTSRRLASRLIDNPQVVVVRDPEFPTLPGDKQAFLSFCDTYGIKTTTENPVLVEAKGNVKAAFGTKPPYFLYWYTHATSARLHLGAEMFDQLEFENLFKRNHARGFFFLNACDTAVPDVDSFVNLLATLGADGVIATEQKIVDSFANDFGIKVLNRFLFGCETIGEVMRHLRGEDPLGLVYGLYSLPSVRIQLPTPPPKPALPAGDPPPSPVPPGAGLPVGTAPAPGGALMGAEPRPAVTLGLPDEPYPGLSYYGLKHRSLYAGREVDVRNASVVLDDRSMRALVVHGDVGAGKSSFLRAGLVPFLETVGYRFVSDDEGKPCIVRPGQDFFAEAARALRTYARRPYYYRSMQRTEVKVDLEALLKERFPEIKAVELLAQRLRKDKEALGEILSILSTAVPQALVLIIDQTEEIFFERSKAEDEAQAILETLWCVTRTKGDFKLIIGVRTDYHGRLSAVLGRRLLKDSFTRDFFLSPMDRQGLLEAVLLPTSIHPIESTAPRDLYGFVYAPGVAERIVDSAIEEAAGDSPLPLVQVVCSQLYHLKNLSGRQTITQGDLASVGGVAGGLRTYVDRSIDEEFRSADARLVRRWFEMLLIRRGDRVFKSNVLALEDGKKEWQLEKTYPFAEYLTWAKSKGLMRETEHVHGNVTRRQIRLGHDAIAPIVNSWLREADGRDAWFKRNQQKLRVSAVVTLVVVLAAFGLLLRQALVRSHEFEKNQNDLQAMMAASYFRQESPDPGTETLLAAKAYTSSASTDLRRADYGLVAAQGALRAPQVLARLGGFRPLGASPDGELVLGSGAKNILALHRFDKLKEQKVELQLPGWGGVGGETRAPVFNAAGDLMAVVWVAEGAGAELVIWSVQGEKGNIVMRVALPEPSIDDLAFNEQLVVVAGRAQKGDDQVQLRAFGGDGAVAAPPATLKSEVRVWVREVKGEFKVAGAHQEKADAEVDVLTIDAKARSWSLPKHYLGAFQHLDALEVGPSGLFLITSDPSGPTMGGKTATITSIPWSGQPAAPVYFQSPGGPVRLLGASDDGSRLTVLLQENRRLCFVTGAELACGPAFIGMTAHGAVYLEEGGQVALLVDGREGEFATVWDTRTATLLRRWPGLNAQHNGAILSAKLGLVAIAKDGTVSRYELTGDPFYSVSRIFRGESVTTPLATKNGVLVITQPDPFEQPFERSSADGYKGFTLRLLDLDGHAERWGTPIPWAMSTLVDLNGNVLLGTGGAYTAFTPDPQTGRLGQFAKFSAETVIDFQVNERDRSMFLVTRLGDGLAMTHLSVEGESLAVAPMPAQARFLGFCGKQGAYVIESESNLMVVGSSSTTLKTEGASGVRDLLISTCTNATKLKLEEEAVELSIGDELLVFRNARAGVTIQLASATLAVPEGASLLATSKEAALVAIGVAPPIYPGDDALERPTSGAICLLNQQSGKVLTRRANVGLGDNSQLLRFSGRKLQALGARGYLSEWNLGERDAPRDWVFWAARAMTGLDVDPDGDFRVLDPFEWDVARALATTQLALDAPKDSLARAVQARISSP